MHSLVGPRLSLMMFLQFFIWGAWWVSLAIFMGTEDVDMEGWIFLAYLTQAIGAIISPFFLGMVADRFFSSERVVGVLHLLGGILLIIAPFFALGAWASPPFFLGVVLLCMLCYMPTIGLTNTVAFANMTDQEKQFPLVRVWGTIGWIVSNIVVSLGLWAVFYYLMGTDVLIEATSMPFYVAGAAAILMGFYSFTLPHTPPPLAGKKVAVREVLGLDAVAQLSSKPFWVFIISSLLLCIPLATYYAYAGPFVERADISYPVFHMSFGQMSEVLFMLLMPLAFRYLGVKWMLLIGMLAWVLRYGLFSMGAPDQVYWMILVGIILHGICYDFFFVTGMVYVEKKASPAIRAQAQGFLVTMTLGVGMFIGMILMGQIYNVMIEGTEGEHRLQQYSLYWAIPAILAAIVMVGFAVLFHDRRVEEHVKQAESPGEEPPGGTHFPPSDAELPP